MATAFGEYFRELRAKLNMPLRQFCIANGYDAGNVFLYAVDGEASTSPKVDVLAYQLRGNPVGG